MVLKLWKWLISFWYLIKNLFEKPIKKSVKKPIKKSTKNKIVRKRIVKPPPVKGDL